MSRNWQSVSKAIQKLAAGVLVVNNEGMFPYETHYVLATDEEVERLVSVAGGMRRSDGRIRPVPARTTLYARAGAEVA
jgi:hypothetical protein